MQRRCPSHAQRLPQLKLQFFPLCNSAARLHGFEDDLHLEGQQFNTILSILYIGYTLMQVPSYATGKLSLTY
jgi:hypothetical protein